MTDLIAELVANGHAYVVEGQGVYFQVDIAARLRLALAPHARGAARERGRARRRRRAQARTGRLRALEDGQAGRAGVGFAVGSRPPGLAHRVLGDVVEAARRRLRHPRRRQRSRVPAPRERDRAGGRRRSRVRALLVAQRHAERRRREDVEVARQLHHARRHPRSATTRARSGCSCCRRTTAGRWRSARRSCPTRRRRSTGSTRWPARARAEGLPTCRAAGDVTAVPRRDGRRLRHARPRSPYVFELVRDANVALDEDLRETAAAAFATVQELAGVLGHRAARRRARGRRRDRRAGRGARGGAAGQGLGRGRSDPRRALARGASGRGHTARARMAPRVSKGGVRARRRPDRGPARGARAVAGGPAPAARRVPVEHGDARRRPCRRSSSSPAGSLRVVAPERVEQMARSEVHQGVVAMAPPLRPVDLDDLLAVEERVPRRGRRRHRSAQPRRDHALGRDRGRDRHRRCRATARRASRRWSPRPRPARSSTCRSRSSAASPPRSTRAARAGCWSVGLDEQRRSQPVRSRPRRPADRARARLRGQGLARLTRDRCDVLVRIPMQGHLASLNVSAAATLACHEVARRRG